MACQATTLNETINGLSCKDLSSVTLANTEKSPDPSPPPHAANTSPPIRPSPGMLDPPPHAASPHKSITSAQDAPEKLNLKQLVRGLAAQLASGDHHDRTNKIYSTCMKLLENYDATSGDWKRYQTWDTSKSYTRNMLYEREGLFALILICWNPAVVSPIHDHSGSECFFRVIEGCSYEEQYEWPKDKEQSDDAEPQAMVFKHRAEFQEGEVSFINDSRGVHRVGSCSPGGKGAVSLHCYVPGYDTSKCWKSPDNALDTFIGRMVYDTVGGKRLAHSPK